MGCTVFLVSGGGSGLMQQQQGNQLICILQVGSDIQIKRRENCFFICRRKKERKKKNENRIRGVWRGALLCCRNYSSMTGRPSFALTTNTTHTHSLREYNRTGASVRRFLYSSMWRRDTTTTTTTIGAVQYAKRVASHRQKKMKKIEEEKWIIAIRGRAQGRALLFAFIQS